MIRPHALSCLGLAALAAACGATPKEDPMPPLDAHASGAGRAAADGPRDGTRTATFALG